MSDERTLYERMTARYASGETPWDDVLPPPEIIALIDKLSSGRALDIGCGYGRASIYMAARGWQVDGVDFVQKAVEGARQRAEKAAVADLATFHQADITDLQFLNGPYDLAADVGCAHALDDEVQWPRHYAELCRLIRPGGRYLLYGRVRDLAVEGDRGFNEPAVLNLVSQGFTLTRKENGVTHLDDGTMWRSAWYWWVRKG